MVLFFYYKVIIKINFSEKTIKELTDEEAKAVQKIFSELSEKMSPDDFKKLIDEIDFSNPKYIEELKGIAEGFGVEVEGLVNKGLDVVDDIADVGNGSIEGTGNFKGTLKGQEIELPNIKTKTIEYTKRAPADTKILRDEFNKSVRSDFIKDFAQNNDLKRLGFSDTDIVKINDGYVPNGYQVHHNLPLDDGGNNNFSNLTLIKNDPYHKVITNYQNNVTKGLLPGETIQIEWPVPETNFYNGK